MYVTSVKFKYNPEATFRILMHLNQRAVFKQKLTLMHLGPLNLKTKEYHLLNSLSEKQLLLRVIQHAPRNGSLWTCYSSLACKPIDLQNNAQ